MPPRDFIGLFAHRAGIGINIYVERHRGVLAPFKSGVNGFMGEPFINNSHNSVTADTVSRD